MVVLGTTEYRLLHYWVEKHLGKPQLCSLCGTSQAKRFEWSNISGQYLRRLDDWQRLCTSCHRRYDYGGVCKSGRHELTEANTYVTPSSGRRQCLACKRELRKARYQLEKASL